MTVMKISVDEIRELGLKPDSHTVSLKDHGVWYALKNNDEVLSLLCIRVQRGELYIGEVFTPKQFRKHGYMTLLCDLVVNRLYPDYSVCTHALASSKHCFERCGFKEFAFRHFKYGDQWWLRRKGKKYDSKEIYD